MAVYFACRSPYISPGGKHLKRFDDDTVLDWFRNRWERLAGDDAAAVHLQVEQEMGCYVYNFHTLFLAIGEQGLPLPATASELANALRCHVPQPCADAGMIQCGLQPNGGVAFASR